MNDNMLKICEEITGIEKEVGKEILSVEFDQYKEIQKLVFVPKAASGEMLKSLMELAAKEGGLNG